MTKLTNLTNELSMENVLDFSFPLLNEAAPAFNVKTTFGDHTI
jgi:hypothetical protein